MRLYGWQKNKWVQMPPDATLDGMGKLLTLDDGTHIYQQKGNADYSLKIISTLPPTLEPYLLYHPLVAQSTKEPVGRRGLKAAKKKKTILRTTNPFTGPRLVCKVCAILQASESQLIALFLIVVFGCRQQRQWQQQ